MRTAKNCAFAGSAGAIFKTNENALFSVRRTCARVRSLERSHTLKFFKFFVSSEVFSRETRTVSQLSPRHSPIIEREFNEHAECSGMQRKAEN